MKRYISLLLIISMLLLLLGCSHSDIVAPVNFYYCTDPVDYNSPEGVISPEVRESNGYENDPLALLNLYIKGPQTDGFRSPFPAETSVADIAHNGAVVSIILNDTFAGLTGHDLTVACVCISKTVIQLTSCTSVQICAENLLLDGNACIEMTDMDFIFLDEYISETQS